MINKIVNKVSSEFYSEKFYNLLQEIKEVFKADEVYILEFDDFSVTCVIHLGLESNCVNYHKYVSDSIERVAFEENIPIVIWDSTKDPRVLTTPFSVEHYTLLAMPISFKDKNFGTITIKRKKEITNYDINLLKKYIDKLVLLISEFDDKNYKKTFYSIISQFFTNFREYSSYNINEFIELIKEVFKKNGHEIADLAVLNETGKQYGNLPCYIDNWSNLSRVCPAFYKDSPYSSFLCKHSKIRNYYCRLIKFKKNNILFSFVDTTNQYNNTSFLLERILELYEIYKNQAYFVIYYKFFEVINNLLSKDYISLDNVFNNFASLFFELLNSSAVIFKNIDLNKKEILSEHVVINPNFTTYSNLIFNYQNIFKNYFYNKLTKVDTNLFNIFNNTFSIIFKNKHSIYLIDIVFINRNIKIANDEIFILKTVLSVIIFIVDYINSIYSEIDNLKLELKNLYLNKKKLEDNLRIYENKLSDLELKLEFQQFIETILNSIDECNNYNELEQKLIKIFEELDNITDFKINSTLIIIWNKVLQRLDKLITFNISEHYKNQIIEIIDNISNRDDFIKYFEIFSEFKLINSLYSEYSLIKNLVKGRVNTIINIPIYFNNEILGTILINSINKIEELNSNEFHILKALSNEIGKFINKLRNERSLIKFRAIQRVIIELFNYISKFEKKLNIFEDIFSFIDLIFKNTGFKYSFIYYSYKRDNSNIDFKLNNNLFENTQNLKILNNFSISLRDLENISQKSNIIIDRKSINKLSDDSLSLFTKKIFYNNPEINNILILPIGSYEIFNNHYEYKYVFIISLSKDLSILDTDILHLACKIPAIIYNNAFLRYINIRDKEILEEMFEIMKEGIIAFDLERNVMLINKSAIKILEINSNNYNQINYRYKIDDLILDRNSLLYSDLTQINQILDNYFNSNEFPKIINKETTYEVGNTIKNIEYFISYIAIGDDIIGYLLVIRDITEKKEIEKEKDDFIASISHDIKTPLTTMKGYITALLRYSDKITNEQRDSYLRVINSEIDRINRMLNNLMDLRKLEGNVLKVNLAKFDLIKVIKKVVNIFELSYVRYEFELITDEDSTIVNADKDKIEQVLHNLLSNAVKYSPAGGKITITVKKTKKDIIVGISDQGMGIPDDEINKIFDKYYRTTEATKQKKISGKGLGLYITKKLIELHNGKIWVESELNKGSTFYFSLKL
jgi:signal transduction histidine kinase